jgi:hypothetical protein
MITICLSGGLGNQMFQYAAALSLATHHHAYPLQIDLTEFQHYDLRTYALGCYNLKNTDLLELENKTRIQRILKRFLPPQNIYREPHFHYDENFFNNNNEITLNGYFQSEKYFKEIESEIRSQFTLKQPLSKKSAQEKEKITNTPVSVSLHVRRGDYVNDKKTQNTHGNLSDDYYKKAIQKIISQHGTTAEFFIFSDEPDYIEKNFDFCPNKHIVKGNNEAPHEDMHLMSCCNHHIIANSSFSWWGAWLNPDKQKTVIAPKQWFSPETLTQKSIKDLIPETWIQI